MELVVFEKGQYTSYAACGLPYFVGGLVADSQGTAVAKVGPVEIGRTGLSSREAEAAGFDAVADVIEGTSCAHYYPDGEPMAVKVLVERGGGRMLGAQIVGGAEAAKRIDALAVAIWNEMTVDDFGQLDLGYAPPFSPVWDPTLIAARRAGEAR